MRDLLIEPIAALGSSDVDRDVDAVFQLHGGDHAPLRGIPPQRPGPDDIAHLVRFCLRGLGVS